MNGKLRDMKKPAIHPKVPEAAKGFGPEWCKRFPAIMFRNRLYVGTPRHKDAIDLAFDGMSHMSRRNVANRIADGKEAMLFGWALEDGTGWEHDAEYQSARMIMYGFD